LLDALPEAVLLVSGEGAVVAINQAALDLFGCGRAEVIGQAVQDLIPGVSASSAPATLTTSCRRGDGTEFSARVALGRAPTDHGTLLVASLREDPAASRPEARLRPLVEVSRAALDGVDPEAMLRHVARTARELAGAELAVVAVRDADPTVYRVRTAEGPDAEALLGRTLGSWSQAPPPPAGGSAGTAAEDARPRLVAASQVLDGVDAGPTLVAPLPKSRQVPACLVLVRPRGGPTFGSAELELVELFVAQAAVALSYITIRDELQRLAIVAERDRIGRELHDGAIQSLFSVGINLQGTQVLTDDPMLLSRLESGVTQIDAIIRDLRSYIFGLRPGGLARRPLDQALYELAGQFERDHGVATTVDADGGLAAELAGLAEDLLQLTREVLSNVAKHAAARTCTITLQRSGRQALLEIRDDGRGYVVEHARGTGWGLRNIEERAAALRGRIETRTALGTGTTVSLLIPR